MIWKMGHASAPTLNAAARLLGIGALLLASACGGGGGGGGGGAFLPVITPTGPGDNTTTPPPDNPTKPTSSGLPFTVDTSALTMAYQAGAPAPTGSVINLVLQAPASTPLFVDVGTPSGQRDPHIESTAVTVTGLSARIVVTPKAGLPPGVYTGTLIIRACADAACTVTHSGSPWSVTYTLTVGTVDMAYAALDTSMFGDPRSVVYDAAHGDIYASYPTFGSYGGLSAIVRFRPSGTGWSATTLSMPGLHDIALAPDASVLAATDTSSRVSLIDLKTFSVKSSHVNAAGIADQGTLEDEGIVFTKDGRLWMPTGQNFGINKLGYFDLRTATFGDASSSCPGCYGGPYFAVSPDGSRLMMTQVIANPPSPPVLYMDVADGVFRPNPIGLTAFFRSGSLSNNGERFLVDDAKVYDRAFGTVGAVPQSSDWVRVAQVSPDGRRVYTLTYAIPPGASSASPMIQVFDSSAPAGTQVNLPQVGAFALADEPGCERAPSYPYFCDRPRMRVTPDGNNLVILGSNKLVVTPIPKSLTD